MFCKAFRAFLQDALVTNHLVIESASLAAHMALVVSLHHVSFWAGNPYALSIDHSEQWWAGHSFALIVDFSVAFWTFGHDAFFSFDAIASWAAFHNAFVSFLLVSFRALRYMVAFTIFKY